MACSWIMLFRVFWYCLVSKWLRAMAWMRSIPRKICEVRGMCTYREKKHSQAQSSDAFQRYPKARGKSDFQETLYLFLLSKRLS